MRRWKVSFVLIFFLFPISFNLNDDVQLERTSFESSAPNKAALLSENTQVTVLKKESTVDGEDEVAKKTQLRNRKLASIKNTLYLRKPKMPEIYKYKRKKFPLGQYLKVEELQGIVGELGGIDPISKIGGIQYYPTASKKDSNVFYDKKSGTIGIWTKELTIVSPIYNQDYFEDKYNLTFISKFGSIMVFRANDEFDEVSELQSISELKNVVIDLDIKFAVLTR